MRYQILKGEKRFFTVENETVGGLLFNITHNDVAAINPAALAASRITVYEILDGKKTVQLLPTMTLQDLHGIQFCNNAPLSEKTFEILREFDFGASFQQFKFNFGTPLNLKNGKALHVEVENGGFGALTTFTIDVETIPVIGLQQFIPVIERIDLDSLRNEQDLNLGSDVRNIVYIPSPTDGVAELESLDIKSDKLNYEMTGYGVYSQLQDTTEPNTDYQNTPVYFLNAHVTVNNLRMRVKFGSAKPNRKLYVVRHIVTPEVVNTLMVKAHEHREENMAHIKTSSCDCKH